jgi:hypothetical protein
MPCVLLFVAILSLKKVHMVIERQVTASAISGTHSLIGNRPQKMLRYSQTSGKSKESHMMFITGTLVVP